MRVLRSKYSDEFKQEALVLIHRGDRSFRELGEALGVHSWTLRDWHRKDEMAKKSKGRKAKGVVTAAPANETPEQEVARLKREVERQRKRIETLEMDREILKKAAAFFAKESE
jgi:transposase